MTATIALPYPARPRNGWLARLRTIMVLRGGHRVVNLPGAGVSVSRRAVSSGAALHVEDSFTAANGTNLNGRTPDVENTPGNAWMAVVQNWSIISNRARGTNYITSVMVIECGAANGTITMPMSRGGNENGIVARYVDASNYWYINHNSGAGFCITEVTGGIETTRAAIGDTSITVVTCTVVLNGNSITANWNGHNLSYTSSNHASATKHGIRRRDFLDTAVADWWKMV